MTSRSNALMAACMAVPLGCLYVSLLAWLFDNHALPGANEVEVVIFVTQVLRVVLVVSVPRLRRASIALVGDLLSLEVFTFPLLVVGYFLYRDPALLSLALAIISAWPAAVVCSVPSLLVYRLAWNMARGQRVRSVLPLATGLFALLAFVSYVSETQAAPGGLEAFSFLMLSTILKTRAVAVTLPVVAASVPLYLSLLAYAASQDGRLASSRNPILVLVAAVTFLSIALAILAAYIASYPLLVFGVPGTSIVTVLWWVSRAR